MESYKNANGTRLKWTLNDIITKSKYIIIYMLLIHDVKFNMICHHPACSRHPTTNKKGIVYFSLSLGMKDSCQSSRSRYEYLWLWFISKLIFLWITCIWSYMFSENPSVVSDKYICDWMIYPFNSWPFITDVLRYRYWVWNVGQPRCLTCVAYEER